MTLTVFSIEAQLRASEELSPISALDVIDQSGGCGSSFHVHVESSMFVGLSALQQQRLVHKALGDTISKLHALTLKCDVPNNTGITVASIEEQLRTSNDLGPVSHIEVMDTSNGCGFSFSLYIVSTAFEGISMLHQQRLVHKALGDTVHKLHALSMKCRTPGRSLLERSSETD